MDTLIYFPLSLTLVNESAILDYCLNIFWFFRTLGISWTYCPIFEYENQYFIWQIELKNDFYKTEFDVHVTLDVLMIFSFKKLFAAKFLTRFKIAKLLFFKNHTSTHKISQILQCQSICATFTIFMTCMWNYVRIIAYSTSAALHCVP